MVSAFKIALMTSHILSSFSSNKPTTTTELNKSFVHLQREVDLRADAVVEGMDTHETVSVNDQRVAHLSPDAKAKMELIIKGCSGGNLVVRQTSKTRTTTGSGAPLSSSTCVTQSSSVLSSMMKGTPMNSRVICFDYASIGPFEKRKDIGQFNEDMPSIYERVIVKLTCTNKGISSFKLLFECYYLWCILLCAYAWLVRYVVCLLVIFIIRYNDMGVKAFTAEDKNDRRMSPNELCDDFPA
ncbi:unnamed protein product [Trichobilharzia regenti]|nr:unnamed protein product [Trichobilharzia regenti]